MVQPFGQNFQPSGYLLNRPSGFGLKDLPQSFLMTANHQRTKKNFRTLQTNG